MDDLKLIKDKYGEKMMHLCRKIFPTILEEDGLLFHLLESHFDYSHELYDDIIKYDLVQEFKDYINSYNDYEKNYTLSDKDPFELMKEAHYNLYECKSQEDVDSFIKYYAPKELLCTFKDPNRLKTTHIFFAVKDNVDEIKRDDFYYPKRQDEYGTSVISIQFDRGLINTLSIKSRYNETVKNSDATFSNNLDFIIPGLSKSFEKYYHFNIHSCNNELNIPNYIKAKDGKFYKYNYKIRNTYYCPNNIIIKDYDVIKLDREKYIVMDYFILDLTNKKIYLYDENIDDSFPEGLSNINKISIYRNRCSNTKCLFINKDIEIELDSDNRIISYSNPKLYRVRDNFFSYNKDSVIKKLYLPNVGHIPDDFFDQNRSLETIRLDGALTIGNDFLSHNDKLCRIYAPDVESIGSNFLSYNKNLRSIYFPNLKKIGNYFLQYNFLLSAYNLDNLEKVGYSFMPHNMSIDKIDFPNLKYIGDNFLKNAEKPEEINLPNAEYIGNGFMSYNNSASNIIMPKVKEIGNDFLRKDSSLHGSVIMPSLETVGNGFITDALCLEELDMKSLNSFKKEFLSSLLVCDKAKLDSLLDDNIDKLPIAIKERLSNNSKAKVKIKKRF